MHLELKLAPSHQGDTVIGIFAEDPAVKVGDTVNLTYRNTKFGPLKVRTQRQTALGKITYKDLIGSMYATPQVFWSRLESHLKTGLPAEFPLWLITFGPELTKDPDIEALEEEAYEEAPKPRTRSKYSKESK